MDSPEAPEDHEENLLLQLGFSKPWLTAGILTERDLPMLLIEFERSADRNVEHIRWRRLIAFMESHRMLEASVVKNIFALGMADPDYSLGGSIMVEALKHPSCPSDLLTNACQSERNYISKIAKSVLEKRRQSSEMGQ